MTERSRFCEQCGASLTLGARFCGRCGQAVAHPDPQAAPPPPASEPAPAPAAPKRRAPARSTPAEPEGEEPVAGVITGLQRRKGLLGYQSWTLVLTPQRLIFALLTQQMINDAVRQAQENAKREGKGLLARVAAQMGYLNLVAERYAAMPVDETVAEQSENFFFPLSEVKKVKVERREGAQEQLSSHLVFETTSGKYEFELKAGAPGDAKQVLQGVLGVKVH